MVETKVSVVLRNRVMVEIKFYGRFLELAL